FRSSTLVQILHSNMSHSLRVPTVENVRVSIRSAWFQRSSTATTAFLCATRSSTGRRRHSGITFKNWKETICRFSSFSLEASFAGVVWVAAACAVSVAISVVAALVIDFSLLSIMLAKTACSCALPHALQTFAHRRIYCCEGHNRTLDDRKNSHLSCPMDHLHHFPHRLCGRCYAHGDRIGMHPAAFGNHYALRRIPGVPAPVQPVLGGHGRCHRLQFRVGGCVLDWGVRRPTVGAEIRRLYFAKSTRPGSHHAIF